MMIDEKTLRRAVELVPDWALDPTYERILPPLPQFILDALAAALVRRVDELPHTEIESHYMQTILRHKSAPLFVEGPDRTENTINAIVQFANETGAFDD